MASPSSPVKAVLYCLDNPSMSVSLQFNPSSFRLQRRPGWEAGGGGGGGTLYAPWKGLQFSGGHNDSLSFKTLLDESEERTQKGLSTDFAAKKNTKRNEKSVLDPMKKLYALTMPLKITDKEIRPPVVAFIWEQFEFYGVITDLQAETTLFDYTGQPKRAELTITLEGQALTKASSADDVLNVKFTPKAKGGGAAPSDVKKQMGAGKRSTQED